MLILWSSETETSRAPVRSYETPHTCMNEKEKVKDREREKERERKREREREKERERERKREKKRKRERERERKREREYVCVWLWMSGSLYIYIYLVYVYVCRHFCGDDVNLSRHHHRSITSSKSALKFPTFPLQYPCARRKCAGTALWWCPRPSPLYPQTWGGRGHNISCMLAW